MPRAGDGEESSAYSPGAWPTAPERTYARRQAALADHYGVDVESRTVETDAAGRIHCLVGGPPDGTPVVLLHGVSTTAATWIPLLPALTDTYRVYVPDRPGRGLSAAPSYRGRDLRRYMVAYLVELFDALGLDQPHVVGNSLGGQQAFLLALDHGRVDRLALVGAPAGLSPTMPLFLRLTTVRGLNRVVFWLLGRGDPLENAREQMARINVVDDSAIPTAFYRTLAAAEALPGRGASLRTLATEQASWGRMHPIFDLREEVVGIERPTAFVWGSDDWFWDPSVGRPVAERMADATFYELDAHGHMPWMEPDDDCETLLRSFLDGDQ